MLKTTLITLPHINRQIIITQITQAQITNPFHLGLAPPVTTPLNRHPIQEPHTQVIATAITHCIQKLVAQHNDGVAYQDAAVGVQAQSGRKSS
jgi:hypothetical protein